MIIPETLNISSLPWLPLSAKAAFPCQPAIYFAIDNEETIQYIGRSQDPKQRWRDHHRYKELTTIGQIKIAYLFVDTAELLPEIETALIEWFSPPLNKVILDSNKQKPVKGVMQVERRITVEAPGLGEKIKAARQADKRSLLSICKEIELTPMYWYKIEADGVKALPIETLNRIEKVLGVNFGVKL